MFWISKKLLDELIDEWKLFGEIAKEWKQWPESK